MGVFHLYLIVQMVPNRATDHICIFLKTRIDKEDIHAFLRKRDLTDELLTNFGRV